MRKMRRLLLCLGAFFVLESGLAPAHPLGNFTINHLAKISSSRGELRVRYILDIAEIPTFQIMRERAGDWSAQALQRWAGSETAVVLAGLHVRCNGVPLQLHAVRAHASLRPGAGGLPILRWTGELRSAFLQSADRRIVVDDRVYADRRIGWKDIVVGKQGEPTDELQHYPSALIGTPRRINNASFVLAADGTIHDVRERVDTQALPATATAWMSPAILSNMFTRPAQTPFFVVLTMLAAFGLGALHAMEPGHGKALLAFTLVGARATGKQALILAGSLTFAHTAGVMLLGVVLFLATGFVSESIYPWITLVSGIAIAIIGARALGQAVHERAHKHSHSHAHAIAGTRPLNFSSAVWAAMSGGIAPCPAAIVVLLAALRLHQLPYGMLLIVIFSLGLAGTLSGLGLGVVRGAGWLARRSAYERFAPYAPLFTALVIAAIGAWTVAQGFSQQGVAAPAVVIAALTLLAIAAYAFTRRNHSHVGHAEVHI